MTRENRLSGWDKVRGRSTYSTAETLAALQDPSRGIAWLRPTDMMH
jgi:hypothetical protein